MLNNCHVTFSFSFLFSNFLSTRLNCLEFLSWSVVICFIDIFGFLLIDKRWVLVSKHKTMCCTCEIKQILTFMYIYFFVQTYFYIFDKFPLWPSIRLSFPVNFMLFVNYNRLFLNSLMGCQTRFNALEDYNRLKTTYSEEGLTRGRNAYQHFVGILL